MISKKAENQLATIFQWTSICLLIGILSGSASAFFLVVLEWLTLYRENNFWIISLLPLAGLTIGLLYHYYGATAVKGNNLMLEEYANPQKPIPFIIAPLVLLTTFITHLFGGSAGREGTAVQLGIAIADRFTKAFQLNKTDRKTLLILGVSAGFASVFGTPLAGALFALEIVYFSKISFKSIFYSFVVAYVAYFTVSFWQVEHTAYFIPFVPIISLKTVFWTLLSSVLFGLAALLFSQSTHFWSHLFTSKITYPPLRPFIGGIVLCAVIFSFQTTKYIGLGTPEIVRAFSNPNASYDFLLKILFTGFTLGAGFKGGEVTPLFFVGATLGSTLSLIVPLPIALLAGMGFVAVFAGATHTPIACTVMGLELFGLETGYFIALACTTAYFCSGSVGIYKSQIVKGPKYWLYQKFRTKQSFL